MATDAFYAPGGNGRDARNIARLCGHVVFSGYVTMQSRQTAGGDNGPGSGMGRPVASNVEDAADLVQRFRVEPALATGAAHGIAVSERLARAIKNVPTFVIVRAGGSGGVLSAPLSESRTGYLRSHLSGGHALGHANEVVNLE